MKAAVIVLLSCMLLGASLVVAGVYVLAGYGVALLIAGALFLGAAALMRNGIVANGE